MVRLHCAIGRLCKRCDNRFHFVPRPRWNQRILAGNCFQWERRISGTHEFPRFCSGTSHARSSGITVIPTLQGCEAELFVAPRNSNNRTERNKKGPKGHPDCTAYVPCRRPPTGREGSAASLRRTGKQCNQAVRFRALIMVRSSGLPHPRASGSSRSSEGKLPICPLLFIHRNCCDCI